MGLIKLDPSVSLSQQISELLSVVACSGELLSEALAIAALLELFEDIACHARSERGDRGLTIQASSRTCITHGILTGIARLLREGVRADIRDNLLLQIGDLGKQVFDYVLLEVFLLLRLVEPGVVHILEQLFILLLVVVVVERSRVALLVDELLALSQGLLKLDLLGTKILNASYLSFLLLNGCLFFALLLLSLFLSGLFDLLLSF